MNRPKLLPVLVACFLLLGGCAAVSTGAEPLPSDDGATALSIEVFDPASFYQDAAIKFEKLTGVKVNVINHYSAAQGYNNQDYAYIDRIPGELMAGKGADIYANVNLDFAAIGEQGYLCNLADWIAADPDISDETYYTNIWRAGFNTGDVYSFPMFMMSMSFGADVDVPEIEGKNLNWEEFFEATKGISKNGVLLGLSDRDIFLRRFEDRYERFIDDKNKTQSLDSPDMIALLTQCKEWSKQGLCIPDNADNYKDIYDNAFIKEYGCDINALTNVRAQNNNMGDNPYWYDIPTDTGKIDKANKLLTTDNVCINAASPHKGTAWKFIKFLLTKDVQATGFLLSINREAAADHISKLLTSCIGYSAQNNDAEQAIQETEAVLDAISVLPRKAGLTGIEKIVSKESTRYFANEVSAEEAAKKMAEAVSLYMKEQ